MGIALLAANVSAVAAAYSSPSVFTLFPQSCTVEFEGAGVEEIYPESSSTSSIVIFPLGIFSPPLPTAPCLFPNLDQVQPPEPPGRSRQWPQDQLFIMYIGVCIPWPPAHDTTIYLSTLWYIRSPIFLVLALTRLRRLHAYGYQISSLCLERTKEMISD